jgi:hypothetical protein
MFNLTKKRGKAKVKISEKRKAATEETGRGNREMCPNYSFPPNYFPIIS